MKLAFAIAIQAYLTRVRAVLTDVPHRDALDAPGVRAVLETVPSGLFVAELPGITRFVTDAAELAADVAAGTWPAEAVRCMQFYPVDAAPPQRRPALYDGTTRRWAVVHLSVAVRRRRRRPVRQAAA